MSYSGWDPLGQDDEYEYTMTTLSVFWPRAEHTKLIARWPHLAAHVGESWSAHRQQVERHCALVDRAGHKVNQLPGSVAEFEVFLKARRVADPSESDLLAYPDLRDATAAMVPWPPARTAPCWCGSGRKYKQCCRRHGLGTLE